MTGLPRFLDPRDRWPAPGAPRFPRFPGPHGEALATLAQICPSLSDERRAELAPLLQGVRVERRAIAAVLLQHAPELFEPADRGGES